MQNSYPNDHLFEELENLDELEELPEDDPGEHRRLYGWSLFTEETFQVANELLSNEQIRIWINHNKNSMIPICLVGLDLNIIWTNLEFLKTLTFKRSPINHCLPELFKLEKDSPLSSIMKFSLEDQSTSFTWTGRLYPVEDGQCTSFVKVMIQPLIFDEKEQPQAYSCYWDIITREFKDVLQKTYFSLLEASKLKDNDTGNHIERVNLYCRLMSQKMVGNPAYPEINEAFIEDIGYLAAMHDVGKIGTPDDILNKEGPLDDWEREIMNEHTKNGAYILSTYPNPMARDIALSHHEKWDGSGYPYGLYGEMIPLSARIVAIADVYDALRSQRSYKKAFSHEASKDIILQGKGSHFDPNLVEVFLSSQKEFTAIFDDAMD